MVGKIIRVTPAMEEIRMEVAELHHTELKDSGLSQLGVEFLFSFYYGAFLKEKGYFCYAYVLEDKVAGFTSFSIDASRNCREAIKRSWLQIVGILTKQILWAPKTMLVLPKMFRSLLSMENELGAEIKAEAMSTAVGESYRSPEFYRLTGLNISQLLYATVAEVLKRSGVKKVKGFTRKSNILVNASLSFLGWKKIEGQGKPRNSSTEQLCVWVWDLEAPLEKVARLQESLIICE